MKIHPNPILKKIKFDSIYYFCYILYVSIMFFFFFENWKLKRTVHFIYLEKKIKNFKQSKHVESKNIKNV